ncbi:hypothetical protein D307_gp162 [Bacillus phage Bastille]|uniref:Uncharacterized protein n=4 Tax=Bastillevirus TaxID=1918010 RepID=J9PLA7_9CAUD|nr:hypothetical protein D307_gp162 [Bacillus phage Bastille]YP_009035363.1 hypothetical protein FP73_gp175 [Bacillus phage Hoody T]YP_009037072.1 hypothetical protein FP74_gp190 [Bacillus phage CAM003]ASU01022.1 hypothetical protein ANTHONY_182 [Bacillus phage Anthony]AEQ34302.1 hypothetical protein [Bacillus phage Bastille]AHZ09606.1 hypothetical protein [Bacillus phage CAM003]AHZ10478.1 hypothetical protein [Bacillus phage Hoody T]
MRIDISKVANKQKTYEIGDIICIDNDVYTIVHIPLSDLGSKKYMLLGADSYTLANGQWEDIDEMMSSLDKRLNTPWQHFPKDEYKLVLQKVVDRL